MGFSVGTDISCIPRQRKKRKNRAKVRDRDRDGQKQRQSLTEFRRQLNIRLSYLNIDSVEATGLTLNQNVPARNTCACKKKKKKERNVRERRKYSRSQDWEGSAED